MHAVLCRAVGSDGALCCSCTGNPHGLEHKRQPTCGSVPHARTCPEREQPITTPPSRLTCCTHAYHAHRAPLWKIRAAQVLLIVNEPNNTLYLSGRNVPTLAINTASAVQVRLLLVCRLSSCDSRAGGLLLGTAAPPAAAFRPGTPPTPCSHAPCDWPPLGAAAAAGRPRNRARFPSLTTALVLLASSQVYDVLNADRVIVEKAALAYLNEWFGGEQ